MAENRGRDAAKVWRTKNRGEGGPMRHMRVDRGEKREKAKSKTRREKEGRREAGGEKDGGRVREESDNEA